MRSQNPTVPGTAWQSPEQCWVRHGVEPSANLIAVAQFLPSLALVFADGLHYPFVAADAAFPLSPDVYGCAAVVGTVYWQV